MMSIDRLKRILMDKAKQKKQQCIKESNNSKKLTEAELLQAQQSHETFCLDPNTTIDKLLVLRDKYKQKIGQQKVQLTALKYQKCFAFKGREVQISNNILFCERMLPIIEKKSGKKTPHSHSRSICHLR